MCKCNNTFVRDIIVCSVITAGAYFIGIFVGYDNMENKILSGKYKIVTNKRIIFTN